ncbi:MULTISPECIES: LysM peptidoglycan-binding domain-containing protein [Bacillus]|uniref:LysM peptidoglycan-binding domain-containing protein n=1 Tax=Bacillus TaxID=1386 RepID=UPI000BB67E2D|nr:MULTISPECIES: LysM peptidoglycan-binding domain-containing protein [Bacillus]
MVYVIQPGDTLYSLATRFNTTLQLLMAYNAEIENPNLIYPGQIIQLPPREFSYTLCPVLRQGDRGPNVSRIQFMLQTVGLYRGVIDGIYGPLTQTAVLTWQRNTRELEMTGIVDAETWTSLGFQCEERPIIGQYIVRPGSSLFKIAIWFGTSVESILRVNPQIQHPNLIFGGQVINIPAAM